MEDYIPHKLKDVLTPKINRTMSKEKKQTFNLRDGWLKLSPKEQQGVTTFFNLHNAANYVYECLSSESRSYIEATIKLNEDVIKKEKKMLKEQGAQES